MFIIVSRKIRSSETIFAGLSGEIWVPQRAENQVVV